MTTLAFFRYLFAHGRTAGLALQLAEVYEVRTRVAAREAGR